MLLYNYVNSGQPLNYVCIYVYIYIYIYIYIYLFIYLFGRYVVCMECVLKKKSKIPSSAHQAMKPMDYNRVWYRSSLQTMFLTILQDRGKIIRLWCELTMQTRHVKLPVGETILPQFNSCDFKSFPLKRIIIIAKKTIRRNWSLLNSKGISFSIKGVSIFMVSTTISTKKRIQYKQKLQIQNV